MIIKVVLNGTDENPWHLYGLSQNPFPQIAKAEVSGLLLHLAALGGDPIPNVEYIRGYLKGWSDEFVELCCAKYEQGKMVEFHVEFPGK